MQPEAHLTIELGPSEAGAETLKTIVLPWSGQAATVRVPAGVADGSVLRLPGLGPVGADGSPQDAYVLIRVSPNPAQFGPPPQYGPPPQFGPPPGPQQYGPPQYGPPGLVPTQQPVRRKNVAVIAAVAVVAVLACCGLPLAFFLNGDDEDGKPIAGTPTGAPSVAPSPSVTPMSPDEYQAALASTDQALNTGFRALSVAKNPTAVRTASSNLATTAGNQRRTLAAVVPPPSVATAHGTLVEALDDLASALTETGSAATSGQICLGPAAVARVSRETATAQLRTAAQALATADPTRAYRVGSFVPKVTKDVNRRLGNGSYVKRTKGGLGQLKIENGGTDAVISIVRGKTAVTRVYVRSKSKFTVYGIRDGSYQIFMTSGKDWDARNKAFSRDCDFEKFDDSLKFTTTSRTYSGWTISLTPVVGGNASTSNVDPDQFPED